MVDIDDMLTRDIVDYMRDTLITPVLKRMDAYSPRAVDLLLHTAIVESGLQNIAQKGGGPALGLYQMEPKTQIDIVDNYLAFRSGLSKRVADTLGRSDFGEDDPTNLMDPEYATVFARLHYLRVPEPLPKSLEDQAWYWKVWYNSLKGKGTPDKFLKRLAEFGIT